MRLFIKKRTQIKYFTQTPFVNSEYGKGKSPPHFTQYAILGASLVMFYLLLHSLSEHTTFFASYLISAAAVVLSISLYTV